MKRAALLAALLLLKAGCVAPADPKELNHPVCQRLVNANLVTIEVIHVNGAKAVGRSLEKAIEGFSKYVGGEVRTVQGEPVELQADENGLLKRGQLKPIIAKSRYRGPSDITILLVPGLSDYEHRGHYSTLPDGHHMVVIQTKNVAEGAPPLVSREKWAHLVIRHELCHALSVPADRSHAWCDRHCTHPDCILYPRPDARAIMTGIFSLGPPMDLCRACQHEIMQAQRAVDGKLLDPAAPYDLLNEVSKLVELNPKHPNVYTIRSRVHARRNDLDSAIADLTKAIEVSGENYLCYLNRAGMLKMRGDAEAARRDLDQMVVLTPNNAAKLNNLAWLLSAHPSKWIRDGSYAVRLAQRACEMSQWKNPQLLDTLAAAYAECGQFDKAVEYQNKAISLAHKNRVAPFRRRLELYRSGKPCRSSRN